MHKFKEPYANPWKYKTVYELYSFYALGAFPTMSFLKRYQVFLKLQAVRFVLFYSCVWGVKLSFLIFFRRLGLNVSVFVAWWWIVVGVVVTSYISVIADNQWTCISGGSIESLFGKINFMNTYHEYWHLIVRCSSASAINYEWTILHYSCAIDIITDAMGKNFDLQRLLVW